MRWGKIRPIMNKVSCVGRVAPIGAPATLRVGACIKNKSAPRSALRGTANEALWFFWVPGLFFCFFLLRLRLRALHVFAVDVNRFARLLVFTGGRQLVVLRPLMLQGKGGGGNTGGKGEGDNAE